MNAEELAMGAEAPYWQGLIDNDPKLQRCTGCGNWHWPAVFRCPDCGGWDQEWVSVKLEGTIFSHTRNWHPFGGLEELGLPFVSLVVELGHESKARLLGILDGDDQEAHIGDKVIGHVSTTRFAGESYPAIRWTKA